MEVVVVNCVGTCVAGDTGNCTAAAVAAEVIATTAAAVTGAETNIEVK